MPSPSAHPRCGGRAAARGKTKSRDRKTRKKMRPRMSVMVQNAVAGKPIQIRSGGDTVLDYTYIKDHARGIIQALQVKTTKNCVFNLSSGKGFSVSQIA